MRRLFLLALMLLLVPSLGCLAPESADAYGYVLALGVDEGEETPYSITILLQQTGGGGETDAAAQGSMLAGAPGESLLSALESLSVRMPFRLDFSRLSTIVISRAAAESGAAAELLLDGALTRLSVRDTVNIAVADGLAREYLGGLTSPLAPNVGKLQAAAVKRSAETGLAPVTTLARFREGVGAKAYDPVVPLGRFDAERVDSAALAKLTEEEQTPLGKLLEEEAGAADAAMGGLRAALEGAAIFDGGRMRGMLSGEQTQLLLMCLGTFSEGRIQLPYEGRTISIRLSERLAPEIEIALEEAPRAQITIRLFARAEDGGPIPAEAIEAHLARAAEGMFHACRSAGSDALGLGKAAVAALSDRAAWERYDWEAAYRRTIVEFQFEILFA